MDQLTTDRGDDGAIQGVIYGHITSQRGIRGGNPIIAGTRIGVHDVIGLLQNGETVEGITSRCFPELTRAQVYLCLAYYEDHRGQIDVLVARQMGLDSNP